VEVANAPLPLDIFTSTPNYAPFTYLPRTYTDATCNPKNTKAAREAEKWDFTHPDEQPGLGAQIEAYMKGLK
jgi:hypothetical protein